MLSGRHGTWVPGGRGIRRKKGRSEPKVPLMNDVKRWVEKEKGGRTAGHTHRGDTGRQESTGPQGAVKKIDHVEREGVLPGVQ